MKNITKTKNEYSIFYKCGDLEVELIKTPAYHILLSKVSEDKIIDLIDILKQIVNEVTHEEAILVECSDSMLDALSYIPVINHCLNNYPFIYKIDLFSISEYGGYKSFIKDYHLPFVFNYHISEDDISLENPLNDLKEYTEYTEVDDKVSNIFKKYKERIQKVTLTKHLLKGVKDSPYDKAEFMYYLDRFKFKTDFSGEKELISEWKNEIRTYYNNAYFMSKKRRLKVV